MHTSDAQPKRRDPPRRRFDADVVLNDDDDDDVIGGEGVDGMRALRAPNNAFPSSRFFANETNDANDAKPPHHRRRERREHGWRTTWGGTAATVAESLKVSKLEIEIERLAAQIRVMKKDVRGARADVAREQQTVAHERKRCEDLTTSNNRAIKENEELRTMLEQTERERDELKRDFVNLGDRATVIAKQNEYVKREYERYKNEAEEMRFKAKKEMKVAKECEKKLKTAEKRISEKYEVEKVQMERRAMKWRDEVLRKASKAKASLEKREKSVKRKEESQESIEQREKEKYEAKMQKMRLEFEQKATEIEREANERGAAAVARFGARASETEVAAVAEAQFAKEKMDEALKECAVAKSEKESHERKCKEAERARKDIADALEKETLQRLKYQAELDVFKVQSEPLMNEIESEKEMKDDFKKRLEMSLRRNVELQEDLEALSTSKHELLDAKASLKDENVRLNAIIKETIESYKHKIENLNKNVKIEERGIDQSWYGCCLYGKSYSPEGVAIFGSIPGGPRCSLTGTYYHRSWKVIRINHEHNEDPVIVGRLLNYTRLTPFGKVRRVTRSVTRSMRLWYFTEDIYLHQHEPSFSVNAVQVDNNNVVEYVDEDGIEGQVKHIHVKTLSKGQINPYS